MVEGVAARYAAVAGGTFALAVLFRKGIFRPVAKWLLIGGMKASQTVSNSVGRTRSAIGSVGQSLAGLVTEAQAELEANGHLPQDSDREEKRSAPEPAVATTG